MGDVLLVVSGSLLGLSCSYWAFQYGKYLNAKTDLVLDELNSRMKSRLKMESLSDRFEADLIKAVGEFSQQESTNDCTCSAPCETPVADEVPTVFIRVKKKPGRKKKKVVTPEVPTQDTNVAAETV